MERISIFVEPEQVFGADFPVIPVYLFEENSKQKHLIAFGLVWKHKVLSVTGYEFALPLAMAELQREHPNIHWEC